MPFLSKRKAQSGNYYVASIEACVTARLVLLAPSTTHGPAYSNATTRTFCAEGLHFINPRHACAAMVTVVVVCVSVCLSASYLTSREINRSTNDSTYSASDKGRNICGGFSETAAFWSYGMKHERKRQYAN